MSKRVFSRHTTLREVYNRDIFEVMFKNHDVVSSNQFYSKRYYGSNGRSRFNRTHRFDSTDVKYHLHSDHDFPCCEVQELPEVKKQEEEALQCMERVEMWLQTPG